MYEPMNDKEYEAFLIAEYEKAKPPARSFWEVSWVELHQFEVPVKVEVPLDPEEALKMCRGE